MLLSRLRIPRWSEVDNLRDLMLSTPEPPLAPLELIHFGRHSRAHHVTAKSFHLVKKPSFLFSHINACSILSLGSIKVKSLAEEVNCLVFVHDSSSHVYSHKATALMPLATSPWGPTP